MASAAPARKADPDQREQDLIWGILLAIRAQSVKALDNRGGLLHRVLAKVLDEKREAIGQALGFVPTPHPLFGEFRCLIEALDEAHRADLIGFLNPHYREIVLKVHPDTAHQILQDLSQREELSRELAERFLFHYRQLISNQRD